MDAATRLAEYFRVTNSSTWGAHDVFDRVDGGKDGLVRALADVTLNVNDIPIDPSPFSSFLVGRLTGRAGLPPSTITIIALFVDVEKDPDHVRMWKAGLEAGKNGTGGGDDERRSNRTPSPSEERALIETTGMSWVEQAALRGAMAMGISLSREQIYEMGHEGDALDSAKFKQLIKSSRPWYMTFVQKNDAKGLKECGSSGR